MSRDLKTHIINSYVLLRRGIAIAAVLLPILLIVAGLVSGAEVQDSLSAYYWAVPDSDLPQLVSPRDIFVGILFAVGLFLFLYQGYNDQENRWLNVAGVLAIGVAIFPMAQPGSEPSEGFSVSMHGLCAVLFFVSIAVVCYTCGQDTLKLIADEKTRRNYRRLYKSYATAMIATPLIAYLISSLLAESQKIVLIVEIVGVYVFSAYWLTKTRELKRSSTDILSVEREQEALLQSIDNPNSIENAQALSQQAQLQQS